MREVNFSIPTANKASVGITTALYDRRALDCTSTLPLINSLNNLAYLTTSSARIRDILTVDGGVERLVCILKQGRSKDMMDMWKWNLAFQCVVNIGVRGSEAVRTRVVEADMVPVIATILENYIQVIEKCREKAELERASARFGTLASATCGFSRSSVQGEQQSAGRRPERSRRAAPPPIEIPQPYDPQETEDVAGDSTPTAPGPISFSSPPERTTFSRQHHHHRSHESRGSVLAPGGSAPRPTLQPPPATAAIDFAGSSRIRPVRDADRLPSMLPTLHTEVNCQPVSPTTPMPIERTVGPRAAGGLGRARRRPSIRHHPSMSGDSDDLHNDESVDEEPNIVNDVPEPIVDIQDDITMQDIVGEESIMEATEAQMNLAAPDVETFNITHRSAIDGSLINPAATPTQATMAFSPPRLAAPAPTLANVTIPNMQQHPWNPRFPPINLPAGPVLPGMPRDEDVLMSLQLLAYVSKYCNLRAYFQSSHLVPRLKLGKDLNLLNTDYDASTHVGPTQEELDEDWDNEFVETENGSNYNIFPLIEKFTARPSSRHSVPQIAGQQTGDMQYWAGV
ncbi:hypothetical protein LTR66_013747, partial [Elasticomyces elasticus]